MNVLIVSAHPDDEVLGCGGTIARHSDNGDIVRILILGQGASSRYNTLFESTLKEEILRLSAASKLAANILGAESIDQLAFPDNRLDSIDLLDIVKQIEFFIDKYLPDTVYVHHAGDVNIDHRRLHEAVVTACRPVPGHTVRRLLSYETVSSTEWQPSSSAPIFVPNYFIDISAQWPRKLAALDTYSSEMRLHPHPRSIESIECLARWRGSQVGIHHAEAFMLLRNIS